MGKGFCKHPAAKEIVTDTCHVCEGHYLLSDVAKDNLIFQLLR